MIEDISFLFKTIQLYCKQFTFSSICCVAMRLASSTACSCSYWTGLYFELPSPSFKCRVSLSVAMTVDSKQNGISNKWHKLAELQCHKKRGRQSQGTFTIPGGGLPCWWQWRQRHWSGRRRRTEALRYSGSALGAQTWVPPLSLGWED